MTPNQARRQALWILLAVVAAIGTGLRVAQFLSDRSLWHDEALLALNVVDRPLRHVGGVLDFAQAVPWPYVGVEWVLARSLGASEGVLRLPSLVAGVGALVVFAFLARRILTPAAAVAATLVLAVANSVVYYSTELKPYSSDVLSTCVILLLTTIVLDRSTRQRTTLIVAGVGAVAILASYAAVFVAVPALTVLVLGERPGGWRETIANRLPIVVAWSLATILLVADAGARTGGVRDELFQDTLKREHADDVVQAGVAGLGGVDGDLLNRMGSEIFVGLGMAQDRPLSHLSKLMVLTLVVGSLVHARRRPATAALLVLPFLATLLAAATDLYPATERTMLFLIPCVALLFGEGTWWPARRWPGPAGVAVSAAAMVAVLAFPSYSAAYHLVHPRQKEEIRPVIEAVGELWRPGDVLVIHPGAQYAFRYYAECRCLNEAGARLVERVPFDDVEGPASTSPAIRPRSSSLQLSSRTLDGAVLAAQLARTHGRVWFLYAHPGNEEEAAFLQHGVPDVLDDMGRRLTVVRTRNAGAYLYELS